jgi:hypothetical protein
MFGKLMRFLGSLWPFGRRAEKKKSGPPDEMYPMW